MLKHRDGESGFPALWDLRGYWGACFDRPQADSDGDGISDQAEEYYADNPEEFEELQDWLEDMGVDPYPDDAIGDNSDDDSDGESPAFNELMGLAAGSNRPSSGARPRGQHLGDPRHDQDHPDYDEEQDPGSDDFNPGSLNPQEQESLTLEQMRQDLSLLTGQGQPPAGQQDQPKTYDEALQASSDANMAYNEGLASGASPEEMARLEAERDAAQQAFSSAAERNRRLGRSSAPRHLGDPRIEEDHPDNLPSEETTEGLWAEALDVLTGASPTPRTAAPLIGQHLGDPRTDPSHPGYTGFQDPASPGYDRSELDPGDAVGLYWHRQDTDPEEATSQQRWEAWQIEREAVERLLDPENLPEDPEELRRYYTERVQPHVEAAIGRHGDLSFESTEGKTFDAGEQLRGAVDYHVASLDTRQHNEAIADQLEIPGYEDMSDRELADAIQDSTISTAQGQGFTFVNNPGAGSRYDQAARYLQQQRYQGEQDTINAALGSGWDRALGTPTYEQAVDFLEGQNQYIERHNEQVQAQNLALAIEHGYVPDGPDRTPVTPYEYLQQLQAESRAAGTRAEEGALEDLAVTAAGNLDFTETGSLEEQGNIAAYNSYFVRLTGHEPTGDPDADTALIAAAVTRGETGALEDQGNIAAYNRWFQDFTDGQLPTGIGYLDEAAIRAAAGRRLDRDRSIAGDEESGIGVGTLESLLARFDTMQRQQELDEGIEGDEESGIGAGTLERLRQRAFLGGLGGEDDLAAEESAQVRDSWEREWESVGIAAPPHPSDYTSADEYRHDLEIWKERQENRALINPGLEQGLDNLALHEAGLQQALADNEAIAQLFHNELADSRYFIPDDARTHADDMTGLSPGQLEKATQIAAGETLSPVVVGHVVLDPMQSFDRESYEQAVLMARSDPELDQQVREYAQGYGLYRLELPESEMNARRLRLLEVLSYGAPIPALGLGKVAGLAARPLARATGPAITRIGTSALKLVRPGARAVPPAMNVADDAAATLAQNVGEFTRLLDAGKTRQARRFMQKRPDFQKWAVQGGLDPADIEKAGIASYLKDVARPNVLQRALGNTAFNVAAHTGRSATVGSGLSGTISTGLAAAPFGGEGWGQISPDERKGILDALWQGAIGGGTGYGALRGVNRLRRGAGKPALGRFRQYGLSAAEGASTDTGLALVPGFQDPTFGRITGDEQLGIALSTVADPAFDAARGIIGIVRHPKSLLPGTVSAKGLQGGTQKLHYSQVSAGDDVELREVTSLADDGITPIATLQPESRIRLEIDRRLAVHPQRIRPGDESGLAYDQILSSGLDPVSGLKLKEDILDAMARGETDFRGVTPSGIPYRFTLPAAYRTGVFDPGAAAHLSPDASFAVLAKGEDPGATFATRSTNPNSVEEVLYFQPGAMALRYFGGSASGNTGADATRESYRETIAGFAGLPNFARRAIGLQPVQPAALVLTPAEVEGLTARNVVEDGPDELPSKSFPGAAETGGRDPLPQEVFGRQGAEAEVVISPGGDLDKRRLSTHILGGGPTAVNPELADPSFRDVWRTNLVSLSDALPFGTSIGLRLDKSPEQLAKAREFFENSGVRRSTENDGRFEVDAVVDGARYRVRTDDDPSRMLESVRSGQGGDVTNVVIRDTETGRVEQVSAPDTADVDIGTTRAPRDGDGSLRTRQEPGADPDTTRVRPDTARIANARADRVDADRLDTDRVERVDTDRLDTARADRVDTDRLDTARVERVDTDRLDTARADRVDAERVDTARADRVDTDRLDTARADRVDTDRLDTARADRVETERLDTARADRVDTDRLDTARADRVDAERVDTARADRVDAERLDTARADRVETERVDTPRTDRPKPERIQRPPGKTPRQPGRGRTTRDDPGKPRIRLRLGGQGGEDKAEQRPPHLKYPKVVRFQTVEDVVVDLETGDTTRTPVGDLPSQTLEVVKYNPLPFSEQHYTGRITDVATDDQGHPFILQRGQFQGQREKKIKAPTERDPKERDRIQKGLQKDIAAAEAADANRQSGSSGVGKRRGSGISTPKPGPTVNRGQGPKSRFGSRTTADRFMRTRKLKV